MSDDIIVFDSDNPLGELPTVNISSSTKPMPSTITMIPPKRTRYERELEKMTIEKLADILTTYEDQADSIGDQPDYMYVNDKGIFRDRDNAIDAEIAYLSEVSE